MWEHTLYIISSDLCTTKTRCQIADALTTSGCIPYALSIQGSNYLEVLHEDMTMVLEPDRDNGCSP